MATKFPREDNPHAAEIYRAIALRFYMRYIAARHQAEFHGEDLPDHGRRPTEREVDEHYERAAEGCVIESVDSDAAALAMVGFAGVIAATGWPVRSRSIL
jgi:hypothetical protein